MRPLPALCIVVAAALHLAAWRMLDLKVLTALADEPVSLPFLLDGGIEVEQPVPQDPAAVPPAPIPPAAAEANEPVKNEVTAWRPPQAAGSGNEAATEAKEPQAGLPRTPGPEPAPVDAAEKQAAPAERASANAWRPGPAPGLRLPPAILRGKAAADLVIDAGDPNFRERARELGMQFILFQDGSLSFFLELQGDELRTAVRRTEVNPSEYSRRARDLAGVRAFDRLRDDVAERYGLDPARCRLAALVPLEVDRTFRAAETAALAGLGRPPDQVVALCGALTGDRDQPLRIGHALTTDGRWLGVLP